MSIGPNVVFNCPCGHKSPPFGSNDTCPPVPGQSCGGKANQCPICYANEPPVTNPLPPPPPMPLQMDTSALGTWRGVVIEPEDGEADSGKPTESGE